MPRLLPALLVSFLLLTGCREDISGPNLPFGDPITNPDSPPLANPIAPLYVKGPRALRSGIAGNYRAEPLFHPDLRDYRWRSSGEGDVIIEPDDPTGFDRLIEAIPTQDGIIVLSVTAYANDGSTLAYGQKTIEIE